MKINKYRKFVLALLVLSASAYAAVQIFVTLYTGKIKYNADLKEVTGQSDEVTRQLAATEAYIEQVTNKTAVPTSAYAAIVYKDGSEEMAVIAHPTFSEPLYLAPNTLRRPPQNTPVVGVAPWSNSPQVVWDGHWVHYEIYVTQDGVQTLINDGWSYFLDDIEIVTTGLDRVQL